MEAVIAHEIEPEVAGPPPRLARLPWRTQALLALAGALAVLLFVGGGRALVEAVRLGWVAAAGKTVFAQVTTLKTEAAEAPGQPPALTGLQYQYTDPFDGRPVSRFVRITADPSREAGDPPPSMGAKTKPVAPPLMRVGDRLPLRIARWQGRSLAYFWRPAPWGKGLFLTLCGLVVMGVSVGLIRTLAHWRRLRTRLLGDGVAVIGTVVHKRADVGDTPRYYLRYGYATVPEGDKREHEEQVGMDQWKRFDIGQPVTVLYDPDHPTQAGLYALIKN